MSSYRFFGPSVLALSATGTNMTGSNVVTTTPMDVLSFQSSSFQANWTGTPTGTFVVLASLDGVNYSTLSASISTNPAGASGSSFIPIYGAVARFPQLQYTNTTGSGALTVYGMSKTR